MPKTRDALENRMRGGNSRRTLPGEAAALGKTLSHRRRLPSHTPCRRAAMAEAGGGRLLPAED